MLETGKISHCFFNFWSFAPRQTSGGWFRSVLSDPFSVVCWQRGLVVFCSYGFTIAFFPARHFGSISWMQCRSFQPCAILDQALECFTYTVCCSKIFRKSFEILIQTNFLFKFIFELTLDWFNLISEDQKENFRNLSLKVHFDGKSGFLPSCLGKCIMLFIICCFEMN